MSIEQHAETAANDIVSRLGGCGLDSVDTGVFAEIVQSAIDEATAPLRARIAKLEGLGPLIREYGASCYEYGRLGEGADRTTLKTEIDNILKGGAP